jgi:hypothetical protein
MKKQQGMLIAFLVTLVWACAVCAADNYGGFNAQGLQSGASSDTAIIFYGKVIDQYGQPVPRAKITGGKEYFNTFSVRFIGLETVKTETDDAGNFTFTGLLVKKLRVKSIEKRCYETPSEIYEKTYSYDEGGTAPLFKPDPAKPVVFVLNKKYDPGVVESKKCRMLLLPMQEGFTVDLFKGFSDPLAKIPDNIIGPDIRVSIVQKQDQDVYILKITAPGEKNGLANGNGTAPHIAPAGGYVPQLVYACKKGEATQASLYYKGRGGTVYSRLEILLTPVSDGIRVNAEFFTNIEGLKNTDFDSIYTEEAVGRIMGKSMNYGGRAYREAVTDILNTTMQKKP